MSHEWAQFKRDHVVALTVRILPSSVGWKQRDPAGNSWCVSRGGCFWQASGAVGEGMPSF